MSVASVTNGKGRFLAQWLDVHIGMVERQIDHSAFVEMADIILRVARILLKELTGDSVRKSGAAKTILPSQIWIDLNQRGLKLVKLLMERIDAIKQETGAIVVRRMTARSLRVVLNAFERNARTPPEIDRPCVTEKCEISLLTETIQAGRVVARSAELLHLAKETVDRQASLPNESGKEWAARLAEEFADLDDEQRTSDAQPRLS